MQKILCRNLKAFYGKKQVLQNVTFSLNQGEFSCLCGPNGSGKSTLLSFLAGVPHPGLAVKSGDVILADDSNPDFPDSGQKNQREISLRSLARKECARVVAYLQQSETCAWNFSVLDYVVQARYAFSSGAYSHADYDAARDCLRCLGIADFAERTVHTLSGGEFQKVRIARAITQGTNFLLMDEPAASLDFVYEPHLMALLKKLSAERNLGILVSVHDINLAAQFADKMNMLSAGGIISGSASQIMRTEILEQIYGVPFQCKKTEFFQSSQ